MKLYMEYCRNLKIEKNPSYKYLRGLFKKILMKNETFNDFIFFGIKIIQKIKINKSIYLKEKKILL